LREIARHVGAVHLSDEAVATTRQGLDEARIFRRVAQYLANFVNGRARLCSTSTKVSASQSFMRSSSARDNLAGLLKQRDKNLKGLLLEFDFDAGFAKFARLKIELEKTKSEGLRTGAEFSMGNFLRGLTLAHTKRPVNLRAIVETLP